MRWALPRRMVAILGRLLWLGRRPRADDGLRRLAGTWSMKQAAEFDDATAAFERLDDEQSS